MSNEPNGFTKYLVIFVDILGSQNRVDFQETYKINKIFHEELERNKQNDMMHTVYFRKIYTFSDCAYIFYGFKDVKMRANYLKWHCVIVSQYFYDSLKKEFFLEVEYLMVMLMLTLRKVCFLEMR